MTQLIGNFEDLSEKEQMEIVNEIASEGLPDGMIGITIKWADDDQNLADEYFELHPGHEDSDLDDAIKMFLGNKGAEYSPENQAKLTMTYAGKEE